jgi:hypothetical protein
MRFLLIIVCLNCTPLLPAQVWLPAYVFLLAMAAAELMRVPKAPVRRRAHAFDQ